jgi:PAS domain S-box-containing protein
METINAALQTEIEARKQAEQKLKALLESERAASENLLRSYFDAAEQAIIAVKADGTIERVNRRAGEMFGYSREELRGRDLDLLLPERLRAAHAGHRAAYFADPRVRSVDIDLAGLRKDGMEFPIEIGLGFVETQAGTLALALVSDVTEQRHVEEQLVRAQADIRDRDAQLHAYLEAASQAVVAVGSDGKIQLVNQRTESMFGYTREELLGQSLELLLPEAHRATHVGHRSGSFAEPRVRSMGAGMDLSGRRKDGSEFAVEIGLGYAQTSEGALERGLVIDIAERRIESELARVNQELSRSNAELAQFAYVASHDLQEPLRMITGYLQLLERRYKSQLNEEATEFIGYAVDGALRMKSLIQDLLRLSRAGSQSMNFREVETAALFDAACSNLKVAIEESGAQITADPLPRIVADSGLLTQVFQNLIANALKFHAESSSPHIHVSAQEQNGAWEFSVRDNGIGIELQHFERIFRIFERLHGADQYGGSGVGLAITQRIVERHAGRIWVESKSGQGSTFFFSIPDHATARSASTGNS